MRHMLMSYTSSLPLKEGQKFLAFLDVDNRSIHLYMVSNGESYSVQLVTHTSAGHQIHDYTINSDTLQKNKEIGYVHQEVTCVIRSNGTFRLTAHPSVGYQYMDESYVKYKEISHNHNAGIFYATPR